MDAETTLVNFAYSTKVKHIGILCNLNEWFTHIKLYNIMHCHLENIGSVNYTTFQMLTHFFIWYQKTKSINFIIHLIRKIFKYQEAIKFTMQICFFQNSNFSFKTQILSSQQILLVLLLEVSAYFAYIWENTIKYSGKTSNHLLFFKK